MGKALLLVVMASSIAGGLSLFQSQQTSLSTTDDQAQYQEEIIAREIARSAYNVGYNLVRAANGNVDLAVTNVNGTLENGRPNRNGWRTGSQQGGTYRMQAVAMGGSSVIIKAEGSFGRAKHMINDDYRVPVLMVKEPSQLNVEFLESSAGYCSAIWLEQYIPEEMFENASTLVNPAVLSRDPGFFDKVIWEGTSNVSNMIAAEQDGYVRLKPQMIFAAGHNRDFLAVQPTFYLLPGTRMNFFISVDTNCSEKGKTMTSYTANLWDHAHHALDNNFESLDQMEESIWAMVEQHPNSNQKWRIAWEDIHNTGWDKPESNDYWNSLQALKRLGYAGTGWERYSATSSNSIEQRSAGYRKLQDRALDFSDQVVEVWMTPIPQTTGTGGGTLVQ